MEIVLSIIGSSALFSFLTFLINRHDGKKEDIKAIKKHLEDIDQKIIDIGDKSALSDARTWRSRILRFYDEVVSGVPHSHDYWKDIIDICKLYHTYCDTHENYTNGFGEMASEFLMEKYSELVKSGEFRV